MKNTRVARRYALAFLKSTPDLTTAQKLAADLDLVRETVRRSREFRVLLSSPVVSVEKKRAILRQLFATKVREETLSFLDLLTEKRREALVPEVIEQFKVLLDEQMGIVNVDVVSAVDLTPPQQQAITKELERRVKKTVRLRMMKDAAIKGGLVVKIGDTVLDASVTHHLERLRQRLVGDGSAARAQ
jgi:F-type H+-transporting ATPase subunit delta